MKVSKWSIKTDVTSDHERAGTYTYSKFFMAKPPVRAKTSVIPGEAYTSQYDMFSEILFAGERLQSSLE